MKTLKDFEGRIVRLSNERLKHILEHPEMENLIPEIKTTLESPLRVIESLTDTQAHLYYRFYVGTKVGDKYMCVVVKVEADDAFVLTAYLTDTIKKGKLIWPKRL